MYTWLREVCDEMS
jgi:hypothetical protein